MTNYKMFFNNLSMFEDFFLMLKTKAHTNIASDIKLFSKHLTNIHHLFFFSIWRMLSLQYHKGNWELPHWTLIKPLSKTFLETIQNKDTCTKIGKSYLSKDFFSLIPLGKKQTTTCVLWLLKKQASLPTELPCLLSNPPTRSDLDIYGKD